MTKIENQMQRVYESISKSSDGIVPKDGMIQLLSKADEINNTTSSSFSQETKRGNRFLLRLVEQNEGSFSKDDIRMINRFIKTGEIPRNDMSGISSASHGHSHTHASPGYSHGHAHTHSHGHDHGSVHSHSAPHRSNVVDARTGGSTTVNAPRTHTVSPATTERPSVSTTSTSTRPSTIAPSRPEVAPRSSNVSVSTSHGTNVSSGRDNPSTVTVSSNRSAPGVSGGGSSSTVTGGGSPVSAPATAPSRGTSPASGAALAGGASPASGANPTTTPRVPSTPPPSIPSAPSAPSAPAVAPTTPTADGIGSVGPKGKLIVNFAANKNTWECHWWPMKETRPGGDPRNNLYAVNGPLDKLDKLTGKNARATEDAKFHKVGEEFSWWGHCNNAAEAACLLQQPKRSVTMKAQDGSSVTFTPDDIQGLLVKAVPCLVTKVDFKGQRFNEASRDDINDPKPEVFLRVIQEWAEEGHPFVMDLDHGVQVWNYAYDKAKVYENTKAPAGFDASALPSDGSVKYYHAEMAGTGYDKQKRVYEFYTQTDSSGAVVQSGWIKTPNTHNNPDFLWKAYATNNVMDRSSWQLNNRATNDQIDMGTIYDIYMQSLA